VHLLLSSPMAQAGQEIESSYGSRINHYFCKSLTMNQFNTAHSVISYLKLHFNITEACHLRLNLSSGPFPLDSHAEILSVFLSYHRSQPARRRYETQSGHGRLIKKGHSTGNQDVRFTSRGQNFVGT
jgi:hypothetical protein